MRTNLTPDEWNKWCLARERIADELKGTIRCVRLKNCRQNCSRFSKSWMRKFRKLTVSRDQIPDNKLRLPFPAALVCCLNSPIVRAIYLMY